MYRVMIKHEEVWIGTGKDEDEDITAESNVVNHLFYTFENATKLKVILNRNGFEVKLVKGIWGRGNNYGI